jgi:hypothetical protein
MSFGLPARNLPCGLDRKPVWPHLTTHPEKGNIMNGSAVYGERVVIVEVHSGRVHVKTGRISSTDFSHIQADNQKKTVVWGDRRFRPAADSPENAYERAFQVDDIHLLKEQEAQSLQDPANVHNWFGAVYQDRLVTKIHRALKRLERK